MGQPSGYSEALAQEICEWLADGKSLRTFCVQPDKPSQSMVYRWLKENAAFREQYAHAREEQAETLADQIIEISDTAEDAQLARLRVDSRKWMAGKLKPKVYGERVTNEVTGSNGGPVEIATVDKLDLARWLALQLTSAIDIKQIDAAG